MSAVAQEGGWAVTVSSLGELLREARKAKGWSQKQLAKMARVHPDTISGWENNEHVPRKPELRVLARLLPTLRTVLANVRISSSGASEAQDLPPGGGERPAERPVERAIGRSYRHLLALDEHEGTQTRQRYLVKMLRQLARDFAGQGAVGPYIADLLDEANRLEEGLK